MLVTMRPETLTADRARVMVMGAVQLDHGVGVSDAHLVLQSPSRCSEGGMLRVTLLCSAGQEIVPLLGNRRFTVLTMASHYVLS